MPIGGRRAFAYAADRLSRGRLHALFAGFVAIALLSCGGATPEPAVPRLQPAESWQKQFDLGLRYHQNPKKASLQLSERYYERALDIAQAFPEDDGRRLLTRYAIARVHNKQGRYRLAESELIQLIPLQERAYGAVSSQVADSLHTLGTLYINQERFREARAVYIRVLRIREDLPGSSPESTRPARFNLATAERGLWNFEVAETIFLQLLDEYMRGGARNAARVATVENGLGKLYERQGQLSRAEAHHQKAIDILVRGAPERNVDYAGCTRDLAELYVRMRRFEEAEDLYTRSLSLFEDLLGSDHFEVRDTLLQLSKLLDLTGRRSEAAKMRYRAKSIRDPRL